MRHSYSPGERAGAKRWQAGLVMQGAHMEGHAGEAEQTAEKGLQAQRKV